MSIRLSRLAKGMLVVAAMALMSSSCWAIYYGLAPSKDEWGLKYDVEVSDADTNTLTVEFILADEGRLKPIYSIELVAFSKQTDAQGGRSYDVKEKFKFKVAEDGMRVGTVKIRREFADRAVFRVLTQMVDGKRQPSGGAYLDIPLKKYLKNGQTDSPVADSAPEPPRLATPPASKFNK